MDNLNKSNKEGKSKSKSGYIKKPKIYKVKLQELFDKNFDKKIDNKRWQI